MSVQEAALFGDKNDLIRFRQHRELHFILCQLIPYSARSWLQGWLEGLALGEQGQAEDIGI